MLESISLSFDVLKKSHNWSKNNLLSIFILSMVWFVYCYLSRMFSHGSKQTVFHLYITSRARYFPYVKLFISAACFREKHAREITWDGIRKLLTGCRTERMKIPERNGTIRDTLFESIPAGFARTAFDRSAQGGNSWFCSVRIIRITWNRFESTRSMKSLGSTRNHLESHGII